MKSTRVLLQCLIFSSLVFTTSCSSGVDFDPGYDLTNVSLSSEEQDFLARINQLRSDHGLSAVQVDPHLQASSRHHSRYMLHIGNLTHYETGSSERFNNRIQLAGGSFSTSGENCACGVPDGKSVFEMWESDAPHLRNMLNPDYQYIGIAEEGDGNNSNSQCPAYYWTTDFGGTN